MTPQNILTPELKQRYEAVRNLLQDSINLATQCGQSETGEFAQTLNDRLAHLQSAALFVVVGEVKAGKSSFINALLGEEVCEVAPDPCTAVIQELVYGEVRETTRLGDYWERVRLPKLVLKEITIVDTPGTNSVIENHQTITENYIPKCDLVIFVFYAPNPHTRSARDLLALVNKAWHRKTVFVLQQTDRATQHELAINRESVKQYARELSIPNQMIFPVSARREQEGMADSGFPEFRDFLRKAVESGDAWRMKMEGTRGTVRTILSRMLSKLGMEQAVIVEDQAFYQELLGKVKTRREKAASLQRLVVVSLCATYDRLARRLEEEFAEGLGIGNVLRRSIPFIRDKDIKTWLKELQAKFEDSARKEIEEASHRESQTLSSEMQAMLDELTQSISQKSERNKEAGSFLQATHHSDILEQLKSKLESLRVADIVGDKGLQASEMGGLALAGGGLAALGGIIAVFFKAIWIDITGGIITAIGALLVAFTLLWKRSGILKEFAGKMQSSRDEFRVRLDEEITKMFDRLFFEVSHALNEPLKRLDEEKTRLEPLVCEAVRITEAEKQLN